MPPKDYLSIIRVMSLLSGIDSIRVINLAHRTDRMELFSENHPFLQCERVDAVYGKTLEMDSEIYSLFKNNSFGWKKNVIGCALSHYHEWQKIANGDSGDRVLVLEDDAVMDKDFLEKWEKMVVDIPLDMDVIFLGGILPYNKDALREVTESINESFANVAKNKHFGPEKRAFHFCTYSYVISKTGAKKLCDKILNMGICRPIDGFMMFYDEANFNQYFSTPLLIKCTQESNTNYMNNADFTDQSAPLYDTDIQNSRDSFTVQDIITVSGQKIYGLDSIIVVGYIAKKMEAFSKYNPFLEDKYEYDAFDFENLEITSEIQTLFKDNDFNWDKHEVARALMHYRIWQKLASDCSWDRILILEDTAVTCSNFDELCSKMLYNIGPNVDFIYLGCSGQDNVDFLEPVNDFLSKPKKIESGTTKIGGSPFAYILTKKGAKKICMLIDKIGFCVKLDILLLHIEKPINIHFSTPFLCTNSVFRHLIMFDKKQQNICIEQPWLEEIFNCQFLWHDAYIDATFKKEEPVFLLYQYFINPIIVEKWIELNPGLTLFLIHLTDENCKSNVRIYDNISIKKVFRNYWRPEVVGPKVIHIPLGYVKHDNKRHYKHIRERQYVWSFAGAMDRPLRKEILSNLENMNLPYKIHRTPTWGTSVNLSENDYLDLLGDSKLVPCMPGFFNVECFRFYEALECGAIPIFSLDDNNSYANILRGPAEPPLYGCSGTNWHMVKELGQSNTVLEKNCAEVKKWWIEYKVYLKELIHGCMKMDN